MPGVPEHRDPLAVKGRCRMLTVVGLGHLLRHDDALGLVLLERLKRTGVPDGVRLIKAGNDPERVDLLARNAGPADSIIVVDAVCMGSRPGTLHHLDNVPVPGGREWRNRRHAPPAPSDPAGPGPIVVVGMEPSDLSYGFGLSPLVRPHMALLESAVRTAIVLLLNNRQTVS